MRVGSKVVLARPYPTQVIGLYIDRGEVISGPVNDGWWVVFRHNGKVLHALVSQRDLLPPSVERLLSLG